MPGGSAIPARSWWRIRETDRWRGRSKAQTPEQKRAHSIVANRGQRAKNEATRELADRLGQEWTADEEQYIVEHPELTNTPIAYELGRTYSAVHSRRTRLRKAGRIS